MTEEQHILTDKKLNEELLHNGYIILPLLEPHQIQALKSMYLKWHANNQPITFYKSYFSDNIEYINEVEQLIFSFCKPKFKEYFIDPDYFGAMFVARPPGIKGGIPPHQDWSLVDEKQSWSLNTWCPLDDTHEDFSILQMLPGSHKFHYTIRGFGIPNYYDHLIPTVEKHFIPLKMKAGEAVFFFHSMVHGSSNNIKKEPRVAIGCTVFSSKAQLLYNMIEKNSNILKTYGIDKTFFQDSKYMKGAIPAVDLLIKEEPFLFSPLSKGKLKDKISSFYSSQI